MATKKKKIKPITKVETLFLSERDYNKVIETLKRPRKLNEKLVKAFKDFKKGK
ncbi:MAG: DUF1778 domain-containing protein [Parvularculaceae bacterium]|jgi:uncharacterized protein (DUF1778 family)